MLAELGITYSGGVPGAAGGFAVRAGKKHTLPGGFMSLLTTSLLRPAAKLETARLLASIGNIDAAAADRQSVSQWVDASIRFPEVRELVEALFRLVTYANDPERQSAGAAMHQLQRALSGSVIYLNGGWQTLVDGLRRKAEQHGARMVTGMRVAAVHYNGVVKGLRLADGSLLPAAAVVLAVSP